MKKAKFISHLLGSYKSSNKFPYGFTLTADQHCVDWGDEKISHPTKVEKIGNFKVIKRECTFRPAYSWGYGGYEAHEFHQMIMVDDKGQHLIMDWCLSDPKDWNQEATQSSHVLSEACM